MVDMAAISGLVGSLKAISDIAKAMLDARDATLIQAHAADLLSRLNTAYQAALDAQTEAYLLSKRCAELENKIAEAENWQAELARYQLVELYAGALAYVVKEAMRGNDPPHYICPACVQKKQKSILQGRTTSLGIYELTCPACGLEITKGLDPEWKS